MKGFVSFSSRRVVHLYIKLHFHFILVTVTDTTYLVEMRAAIFAHLDRLAALHGFSD